MALAFKQIFAWPAVSVSPAAAPRKAILTEVTLDGTTYAAGGYPVTAANFGLTKIDYLLVLGAGTAGTGAGICGSFDIAASKLKFYKTAAAVSTIFAEIAAADGTGMIAAILAVGE